ncbi:MAG: hypothetical protein OEV43_05520 [Coriobacteriia bacterium]|nr:hypothetical protein [Coriobacteriia bacterium]
MAARSKGTSSRGLAQRRRLARTISLFALIAAIVACSSGCASEQSSDSGLPAGPDLSTPGSAVRSYLDWVSYAYRTAESDVASHTMTPWEGVRVDSYIELNRQDGRAIEQSLTLFEVRSLEAAENTATLAAYEEWDYRYFSLQTGEYVSEPLEASYDSTYTVVLQPDGRWLVDKVEVTALGEVE